ncbi:MAG: BatA domain-containing protein [Opitutaceae bacterium]|jgi:hypothetical protein
MNWLSPNFLFVGAAIVLPLALHLLRRRVTRTIPFPALRFLAPNQPRQRRQNFYRRLVLTLRCLALAMLAAAFARPFFGEPAPAYARASVVVIDNSFSLQTGDRWSRLKSWTHRELGIQSPGDTIGLLLMNPRPTWLVPPTRDTAAALAALDALPPGWETTRAEPALRLAADTLAAGSARSRKLIYLGDHQAVGWAGSDFARKLPPGVVTSFPDAPATPPAKQAALLSAAVTQPSGATVVASVTVHNFGAAQKRTLKLFAGDDRAELHAEPLDLAANETRPVRLTLPAAALAKGWIRFALDPDDLPADDTAWALAPAAAGARRLILLDRAPAGADADYAGTACQTLATLPPTLRIAPVPAAPWPAPAAAILRNETSFTAESSARLDAFLAAGGSAFIFLDGDAAQLRWLSAHGITVVAQLAGEARIRDWSVDHPLVAPLANANLRSLVGWSFKRGWSLPADAVEPLASWSDGTHALGELRIGAGRVLIAGFTADRRDGDWPIAPAFVPFLHRVALHLLDTGPVTGNAAAVGQPLSLPDGAPGSWRALAGPDSAKPASTVSGAVTPTAPGVYEWSRDRERSLFAVNLPPEESDLAAWPEGAPWNQLASAEPAASSAASARVNLAAQDAERQSPLWWWCFAAMAVFALAELAFSNRTSR